MTLEVERFSGAGAFLDVCGAHLMEAEVENALFLGLAHALRQSKEAPPRPPYFAAVRAGGEILCCAFSTVPDKIGTSRSERSEALELLARDAHEACPEAREVLGPEPTVRELAERIAVRRGTRPSKRMAQGLYSLTRVNELDGLPEGSIRVATESELELAAAFMHAFMVEIREPSTAEYRDLALHRIRTGSVHLWEQGGQVVSMAAWSGKTPNGVRVSFVYTPPEHRRRGYATACVQALSRHLLERGNAFVCLYTDLSNSTSNAVYQRIGYEPVCEAGVYRID